MRLDLNSCIRILSCQVPHCSELSETARLSSELIKFYTLQKRQDDVVFRPLTVTVCEVTFVCAFIITVAKML